MCAANHNLYILKLWTKSAYLDMEKIKYNSSLIDDGNNKVCTDSVKQEIFFQTCLKFPERSSAHGWQTKLDWEDKTCIVKRGKGLLEQYKSL